MDSETIYYPRARREDTAESKFGNIVADPYRWLENPDSEDTHAFVKHQNEVSHDILHNELQRQFLEAALKYQNYPKFGVPFKRGDWWYSWRNSGLQNQDVLYKHKEKADVQGEVVIDPNLWDKDGSAFIGGIEFSHDGSLLAYTKGNNGSDWRTVHVLDVKTKELLPDHLQYVKFSNLSWTEDNRHLFYSRYPFIDGVMATGLENTKNEYAKLYMHTVGTPQTADLLLLEFPNDPTWLPRAEVTDDGRFIVVSISHNCDSVNQLWIASLPVPGSPPSLYTELQWKKVAGDFEASLEYVANDGEIFYFLTNKNAPRGKVVSVDINNSAFTFIDVVAESANTLENVVAVAMDKIVMEYTEDVKSRLSVHNLRNGGLVKNIDIPLGAVTEMSGRRNHVDFLFKIQSFNTPGRIYDVNMESGNFELALIHDISIEGLPLSDITVTQEFYNSKDGTRVPMFLIRLADRHTNVPGPMLMYGYGGFNISLKPFFSLCWVLALLYLGVNLAIPNIRGGGEYGREWYKAAVKTKKQVSYDDFQSAAEYVIRKGYTISKQLVIMGGSNGGLLVAACANQRPDLFRAVIANRGVLDLMRFHKFTIGHAWTSDYGDPDKPEDFESIIKISPLHNISREVVKSERQPAVLVLTGDHDDRVSPFHSLKYIAELQHAADYNSPRSTPLIAFVDTKSGHGMGKPLVKALEEHSLIYGFIASTLGLTFRACSGAS